MGKTEINKMNVNKSCGPDAIHPRLVKELVDHISEPIALMLNKSVKEGKVPGYWFLQFFKKGSKHIADQ